MGKIQAPSPKDISKSFIRTYSNCSVESTYRESGIIVHTFNTFEPELGNKLNVTISDTYGNAYEVSKVIGKDFYGGKLIESMLLEIYKYENPKDAGAPIEWVKKNFSISDEDISDMSSFVGNIERFEECFGK